MRALVACEESQRVCIELRRLGHEAYSCDILPCSGGHPEWHIQGDALAVLDGRCSFFTMDGTVHTIDGRWDLIIAHPPCTYLSHAGNRWYSLRVTPAEKVVRRIELREEAIVFFMRFIYADCDRVAVENPIGRMNAIYRPADQIINPYQFADSVDDAENYVCKATCLWLKGLPPLRGGVLPKPAPAMGYRVQRTTGKIKANTWTERVKGPDRQAIRSKTFSAIARAMAEQWAGDIREAAI